MRCGAQAVRLGAVAQHAVLDVAGGGVLPCLGQAIVDEGFQLGRVVGRLHELFRQLAPGQAQPSGVIQAVRVIAAAGDVRPLRHPADARLAAAVAVVGLGDHVGFLMLADHRAAVAAAVPDIGQIRRPLQAGPYQGLFVAALGTGHVEPALVGLLPLVAQPAVAHCFRRADLEPLGPHEGGGAPVQHVLRVVAGFQFVGEAGEFIGQHHAGGCGFKAHRRAGVFDVELPAFEVLERAPIGSLAAVQAHQDLLQRGRFLDQRVDLLVDQLVHGHFGRKRHDDRHGVFRHGVAHDVHFDFRFAELDGQDRHHVGDFAARTGAVHDFHLQRVAHVAPGERLGAALLAQSAVLFRPLGHQHRPARRDGTRERGVHDVMGGT